MKRTSIKTLSSLELWKEFESFTAIFWWENFVFCAVDVLIGHNSEVSKSHPKGDDDDIKLSIGWFQKNSNNEITEFNASPSKRSHRCKWRNLRWLVFDPWPLSKIVFHLKVQMKCFFLLLNLKEQPKSEDRRLPFLNISSSFRVITV